MKRVWRFLVRELWNDDSVLLAVGLGYIGMELVGRPDLKLYACCAALGFFCGRWAGRRSAARDYYLTKTHKL